MLNRKNAICGAETHSICRCESLVERHSASQLKS
jgi:hypothetical protein